MTNYKAIITKDAEGAFYALVARIEDDGYKTIINHYKGRHFKTEAAAVRSTTKYISTYC